MLGPAEAWRRTVQAALDVGVAAVVLAGDVVEREDDFFEAFRVLSTGTKHLTEGGIAVLGVAGNHDVKVLPRLAKQIKSFRLLGANGNWEHHRIEDGRDSIVLWGWSFPRPQVLNSPIPPKPFERQPGVNWAFCIATAMAGRAPTRR